MIVTYRNVYNNRINTFAFDTHKTIQGVLHLFENIKTGKTLFLFSYEIMYIQGGDN